MQLSSPGFSDKNKVVNIPYIIKRDKELYTQRVFHKHLILQHKQILQYSVPLLDTAECSISELSGYIYCQQGTRKA